MDEWIKERRKGQIKEGTNDGRNEKWGQSSMIIDDDKQYQ